MNLKNIRSKSLVFLFFTLIFLILLIRIKTFFNFYDEGFAMFGATRVLNGDAPYKDFWAIYPPGQFYNLAMIIKLFGANLLNARIYDTLIRLLAVIGVYLITKRTAPYRLALLAALIAGFLLASAGFYSYAVFPALALGLWSIYAWLRYTEHGNKGWLLLAGALLGIAIFIRWDIGSYAAIGVLTAGYLALLVPGLKREQTANPQHVKFSRKFHLAAWFAPLKELAWILAPMLAIALLSYTVIGFLSGWNNLFEQVFYFPTSVLHSVRWLPYPHLIPPNLVEWVPYYDLYVPKVNLPSADWTRFYMPILTLGISVILLCLKFIKERASLNQGTFALVALTLFGALLFNQALSRYDGIHVTPASILTFMAAVAFFQQFTSNRNRPRLQNSLIALVVALTILYFAPSLNNLLAAMDTNPPWGCFSRLPIAGCVSLSPDQERTAELIQAYAQPSEPIFVGNQKHDRIFVSDIGLYYLAGRPSATRYHELYPGVATTLTVQEEIVTDLEAQNVQWVVLVKIWDSNEPNGSALSSGVTYLDDYLRAHYWQFAEYGIYKIFRKSS